MQVILSIPGEDRIDLTEFLLSGDDFSIEITRDPETGSILRTLSSPMQFTGQGYAELERLFFSEELNGCENRVNVIVAPECCGCVYGFELDASGISLDPVSCIAETTLQAISDNQRAYECLRDRPFWWGIGGAEPDGAFRDDIKHPRIRYCRAPFDVMVLANIVSIMIFILTGLNAIGLDFPVWLIFIAIFASAIVPLIISIITNCRGWHIAPYIYDILSFNCKRCGLELKSTIFTGRYKTAAILQAQLHRGDKGNDGRQVENWNQRNAPNLNVIEVLELLKPVFNGEYRIGRGELLFESGTALQKKDAPILFNMETALEKREIEEAPTYRYNTDQYHAYGVYEYALDAIDDECNNVKQDFDAVVDFKKDGSICRKGAYQNPVAFSVPHTTDDQDNFMGLLNDIARDFFGNPSVKGQSDKGKGDKKAPNNVYDRDETLVLTKHSSSQLKLLYLDAYQGGEERYIVHNEGKANTPFYFDPLQPDGLWPFHDGAQTEQSSLSLSDVEFAPVNFCQALKAVEKGQLDVRVQTRWGFAVAESITLNFSQKTLTLTGLIIQT